MMDTILNLGLNDEAVEGLARTTGNPRFAYDSYRRLIQMYGEVVDGVDAERFENALTELKKERGAQQDVDLTADDLRELAGTFKRMYEEDAGSPFPQDAHEQLRRAVLAVFDSWETPRAQVYRRAHRIPEDIGTAVNVVQMVFGNKGGQSGTGVALHTRPLDRRAGALRRVPRERPGRGRRRRHPHAAADRGDARGRSRRRSTSCSRRCAASSSTTVTCRTSSSRSRTASSTSCRRARRSARRPRRSRPPRRWSTRA